MPCLHRLSIPVCCCMCGAVDSGRVHHHTRTEMLWTVRRRNSFAYFCGKEGSWCLPSYASHRPVALSIQNLVPQPKAGLDRGRRSGSSDAMNEAESDLLDFFPELVVKIKNKLFQDEETPMSSFRQHPPLPPSDSSDESEGEAASARATFRGSDSSGGRSSHLGVQKNRQLQSIKPDPASGLSSPILAMWEPNVEVARQTSQNTSTPPRQSSEQLPFVDVPTICVRKNAVPDSGEMMAPEDGSGPKPANQSQTLLPAAAPRSKRPVSLMKYNDPDKSSSRLK